MVNKKISAVYQIKNVITGDFYIGSSKDLKERWKDHKCPSTWKIHPNSPLYKDMQKYGLENFKFMIIVHAYPEHLKRIEQELIEILKPTYNQMYAKGNNVKRRRESNKRYYHTEKFKKAVSKYRNSDKYKELQKKYFNQSCIYNGEILTLSALRMRFARAGIHSPFQEAKKYLVHN